MDVRELHLNSSSRPRAPFRDSFLDSDERVSPFRGILVGLWLTCSSIVVLTLVPGVGISLGNLPGDIVAGTQEGSVRLPLATLTLVFVTLTGLYIRIASYLSRH